VPHISLLSPPHCKVHALETTRLGTGALGSSMAKQVTGLVKAMKAAEGNASAHRSGVMASSTTQRT